MSSIEKPKKTKAAVKLKGTGNYNMQFIQGNYYLTKFKPQQFDGVLSDPPYYGSTKGTLAEQLFDFDKFMSKTDEETTDAGFLICFSNFICCVDFINASKSTNWTYHVVQIWDKRPTATLISEQHPRRHTEYILYFNKKKLSKKTAFKFSFLTGEIKSTEGYSRGSIGTGLRPEESTSKKGMKPKPALSRYDDALRLEYAGDEAPEGSEMLLEQAITVPSERVHPTQKPKEFSYYFAKIVKSVDVNVIDPFCGSGSLLTAFNNAIGVDIIDWRNGEVYEQQQSEQGLAKAKGRAEAADLSASQDRRAINMIRKHVHPAPIEHQSFLELAEY